MISVVARHPFVLVKVILSSMRLPFLSCNDFVSAVDEKKFKKEAISYENVVVLLIMTKKG